MNLYLNSSTDYSIVDDKGKKYTIEEAKKIVETGQVEETNQSLQRLISSYNWDIKALKQYYREVRI